MTWQVEHFSDLSGCWLVSRHGPYSACIEHLGNLRYRVWVWETLRYDYNYLLKEKDLAWQEAIDFAASAVEQLLVDDGLVDEALRVSRELPEGVG